jgi:hypothetical protein
MTCIPPADAEVALLATIRHQLQAFPRLPHLVEVDLVGNKSLLLVASLAEFFAWRHCRARNVSVDHYFTVVVFNLQSECRFKMVVVNCFDAVFGVKLKRALRALLVAGFTALLSPFKLKAFLYQFAVLRYLAL